MSGRCCQGGAINAYAGRRNFHRIGTIAEKAGIPVVVIGSGHRNDVVQHVVGRIVGAGIVITVGVPGSGGVKNRGHARLVFSLHRIFQSLRESASAPTAVGDSDVLTQDILQIVEILEALYRSGGCTTPGRVKELASSNAHRPVDSGYAGAVPARGANGAGHVGTVAVVVHGIAAVGDGVDSMNIIDITVAVVIDAVGCLVVSAPVQAGLAGRVTR